MAHTPAEDGSIEDLIGLSRQQLAEQLQAFGTVDSKAGAVVGFDSIAAGMLFALNGSQARPYWLFLAAVSALGLSILTAVLAMWTTRPLLGPNPEVFYRLHAGRPPAEQRAQLLADLVDASVANDAPLARKLVWWGLSAGTLALAAVAILVLRLAG